MSTLEELASAENSKGDDFSDLDQEILRASTDEVVNRTKLLENETKVYYSHLTQLLLLLFF